MIKTYKIRLKPTLEQEILLRKHCGIFRYAYNYGLNLINENYKNDIKYDIYSIRKQFTQHKKELEWLNETSSNSNIEAFRNLDKAMKQFFKSKKGYPKFKSKRKSKMSFYVYPKTMHFYCNNRVRFEGLKKDSIIFSTNYKIPTNVKYANPYCTFDGKYWYLSFGVEVEENQTTNNSNKIIGIDLGVKELCVTSENIKTKNINKSKEVKRLKKVLKRKQRKVSRKYILNKKENNYVKTNNIIKLEDNIRLIYRRLSNIRDNHINQTINNIIKSNPKRIVMEDLNISGMMKNKHLSKAIQEQKFYSFIMKMNYKCEWNNIEFIQSDRWFPSSKICSHCGKIKKDLKLSDRIYRCECGLSIDRDYNASINLANYKLV